MLPRRLSHLPQCDDHLPLPYILYPHRLCRYGHWCWWPHRQEPVGVVEVPPPRVGVPGYPSHPLPRERWPPLLEARYRLRVALGRAELERLERERLARNRFVDV